MVIGTTKELKNHEYRVGLTPDNVLSYVAEGHTIIDKLFEEQKYIYNDCQNINKKCYIKYKKMLVVMRNFQLVEMTSTSYDVC